MAVASSLCTNMPPTIPPSRRHKRIIAPVYTGYWRAYQSLLDSGYHMDMLMLRMKRGKTAEYEHEEDYVLDDWR